MPIFEYECNNCATVYEVLDLKAKPDDTKPCPKCKTMNGKIMSATAVHLKDEGVGWASKGYSRKSSVADGPQFGDKQRHKASGKTTVPVSNRAFKLEGNKSTAGKKKPMLAVKK